MKRRSGVVLAGWLVALAGHPATAQTPQRLNPSVHSSVTFSLEMMRQTCPEFSELRRGAEPNDLRDCRVSKFGEVGVFNGQTYYYVTYCLIPNDAGDKAACTGESFEAQYFRDRGLAIFVRSRSSETATLLLERASPDVGIYVYLQKPQIVERSTGALFVVPITVDGTGSGNASEYYLWSAGAWESIEAESWLKDLQRRLPAGVELWKGIWPDVKTMTAETSLYLPGDANCCPTGGTAHIRLAIRSRQFVVSSVTVNPPR